MQQLSVADVLSRAADLIEPEGRWTTHTLAKTELGYAAMSTSPHAVCWCAMGAIQRVAEDSVNERYGAVAALQKLVGSVMSFNDAPERQQSEVVAALRAAAELAKASS